MGANHPDAVRCRTAVVVGSSIGLVHQPGYTSRGSQRIKACAHCDHLFSAGQRVANTDERTWLWSRETTRRRGRARRDGSSPPVFPRGHAGIGHVQACSLCCFTSSGHLISHACYEVRHLLNSMSHVFTSNDREVDSPEQVSGFYAVCAALFRIFQALSGRLDGTRTSHQRSDDFGTVSSIVPRHNDKTPTPAPAGCICTCLSLTASYLTLVAGHAVSGELLMMRRLV